MATLTLKKPTLTLTKPSTERTSKHIETTELANMAGKFAVFRRTLNRRAMRFTCLHDTQESATHEAKRLLAESSKHFGYTVLKVVDVIWE